MKQKFVSLGIVFIMFVSTVSMFVTLAPELVTPQDDDTLVSKTTAFFSGVEKTWDAAGDAAASAPASWSPVGALGAGDNVTFDATSVTNCDWDVEVTLGQFTVAVGYSGVLTQTADFGCHDFTWGDGTFYTGVAGPIITLSGNLSKTGGVITDDDIILIFTGDTVTFQTNNVITTNSVEINGNVTLSISNGIIGNGNLIINSGKTFTINKDMSLNFLAPSGYTNDGTITGTGGLVFWARTTDIAEVFGDVTAPIHIVGHASMTGNRLMTLLENTVLDTAITMSSAHASYTITLDNTNYELSVSGLVTLNNRAIMTQGTGTWSFGSYLQAGISSVFNQGATLTIGTDFTVSDGIFNAIGDMTVPGDWDTATGDYVNDDNVVYLSGASKTLAMNAADSFYNVTVSGSYTMDTDTTVRLRATISGTLSGTGDFIEPEPEFTSTAWLKVCPLTLYDYEVTQTYWDTLSIVDAPYWLDIYDGHIKGIPGDNETGLYNISLALTWNDMIVYQNYTLIVCPEEAFVTFEFLMYFAAMLILLVINIVGAVVPQVRILTLFGIFGIAILCVPTALVMIDYGYIALVLILVNIMVPVMSTVNNIKEK